MIHPMAILAGLAGGIGLFIFGMQLCSEGLQKMAAHRLRQWVKTLTAQPILGLIVGAVITLGLQSSSATSALVVGFVSAKMMTLGQALGVLLGSAIGASLTAQLIVFKITNFALVLICLGTISYLFSKRSRQRHLGQTLLGFGLIFYGMFVMAQAMAPVREYPAVGAILTQLARYPLIELLVGTLVTAIFQSSPAFLALLMTLATQHLIGPTAIIPFVLGAHLGGTLTGVLSSLGAPGLDAKRAAVANFLFKLVNGLIFLPFYRPLTDLFIGFSPDMSRMIANTHTFFSLAMAVVFLPFTSVSAKIVERLIPDRKNGLEEAAYLDRDLLNTPELAVDQAHRQTNEMGHLIVEEMLNRAMAMIRYGNEDSFDRIQKIELAIDSLYKQISKYLTSLGGHQLSEELMDQSIQILYVANDLELIGDVMTHIVKKARTVRMEGMEFSDEGLGELENMFAQAKNNFEQALKAFETMDATLATGVIKNNPKILRLEKDLRYSHFDRLHCGNEKTVTSSTIHLDLIESILRINSHAVAIAQVVVGIV